MLFSPSSSSSMFVKSCNLHTGVQHNHLDTHGQSFSQYLEHLQDISPRTTSRVGAPVTQHISSSRLLALHPMPSVGFGI